jgi:hypothetical protein
MQVQGVMADPVRPSDLYALGTDTDDTTEMVLLKSTDHGATWVKKRTRRLVDYDPAASASANSVLTTNVIHGSPWGVAIDPNPNRDPNTPPTIYTPAGFCDHGLYKSTDGGDTWQQMTANDKTFEPYRPDGLSGHDFYQVAVLPDNMPNHILVTYHYGWKGSKPALSESAGLGESRDGGKTWIWHSPPAGMGNSQYVIALDATTWLTVSNGNGWTGTWRTTTAGLVNAVPSPTAWEKVYNFEHIHGSFQPTYVDGALYMPGLWNPDPATLNQQMGGVLRSTDKGKTWQASYTTNAFSYMANTVATASRLYAFNYADGQPPSNCASAPRGSSPVWTSYPCPAGMTGYLPPYSSASTHDSAGKRSMVVLGIGQDIWRLVESPN